MSELELPTPDRIADLLDVFEQRGESELVLIRKNITKPESIKLPRTWGINDAAALIGRSVPWLRKNYEGSGTSERGVRRYTLADINKIRSDIDTLYCKPKNAKAHICSILNFKGGVGKTTTTIHLAHRAAIQGLKVLVLDLDPQASCSFSLGNLVPDLELEPEMVINDALLEDPGLMPKSIIGTYFHNVDLIPTNLQLQDLEYCLPNPDINNQDRLGSPALRLTKALAPLRDHYDLILLDCPPNLGSVTTNAVLASNVLLVPVPPHAFDRASFVMLTSSLSKLFAQVNKSMDYFKVLVTNHPNTKTALDQENRLRFLYDQYVLSHCVYQTTEIEKASALMSSVYDQMKPLNSRETYKRALDMLNKFNDEILSDLKALWENC